MIDDIKDILKSVSYEVIIEKLDNGCLISYPNKIHTYDIIDGGFLFLDETLHTEQYNIPNYAIRVAIMMHIIKNCQLISYPSALIRYKIGEEEKESIEDILYPPINTEKEEALCGILMVAIERRYFSKTDTEAAESVGVFDAFQPIKQMLEVYL